MLIVQLYHAAVWLQLPTLPFASFVASSVMVHLIPSIGQRSLVGLPSGKLHAQRSPGMGCVQTHEARKGGQPDLNVAIA